MQDADIRIAYNVNRLAEVRDFGIPQPGYVLLMIEVKQFILCSLTRILASRCSTFVVF